jgi:amino acid adenylation domain-containing protein
LFHVSCGSKGWKLSRLPHCRHHNVLLAFLIYINLLSAIPSKRGLIMRTTSASTSRADRSGPFPLSFAQQGVWFLAQIEGLSPAYHMRMGVALRGKLDQVALRRALNRIVARHEVLRTSFVLEDGEPAQRIVPAEESCFHLLEHDLREHIDAGRELECLIAQEARTCFDLKAGPLISGHLIRQSEDEHTLLITVHHIVFDGWSVSVLINELSTLYDAFVSGRGDPLPDLRLQYADYAIWQQQWMRGDMCSQQAEYWKATLTGAPVLLELPADHARPVQQDYAGAVAQFALDEKLTANLRRLGKRHRTTLYMTLLAGWTALLGRLSGQQDVVVGTPVANRGRVEIEPLVGLFVNTLALRIDLSGLPTVKELLERVKIQTMGAQRHQDIPFEQVVEIVAPVRSLAHNPVFQAMFAWENVPSGTLQLEGVQARPFQGTPQVTTTFDVKLVLQLSGERIVGGVVYATALFERTTMERYVANFRTLLERIVRDENDVVDRLSVLTAAERQQVLYEWNDTTVEFSKNSCIHELFEEQVGKTPEAVALVFEEASLSYAELNRRANQLAHHLIRLGVKPDGRVGIWADRSLEMMVGLLAVLKAGGAYVPLEPSYPSERLRCILEDSRPTVVLTLKRLRGQLDGIRGDAVLVVLDSAEEATGWESQPERNPDVGAISLTSRHLAYVIYTSGSMGAPKGVMVEHKSLVNLITWSLCADELDFSDAVLQETPVSSDAAVSELFRPLVAGARLVLPRPGGHKDPAYLVKTIQRNCVTIVGFAPMMLRAFLEDTNAPRCSTLRRVLSGGEDLWAMDLRFFQDRLPNAVLENQYGPTETTLCATYYNCHHEEYGKAPIGKPIANSRIYVLDNQGEPAPIGVVGELYIGGAGVARGYSNGPQMTAEWFVADPFAEEPGARIYRTGDLGKWRGDGNIDFVGRNDLQVKVRGCRVELEEIEVRLASHATVKKAVVVVRKDVEGEKQLVAYYTCKDGGDLTGDMQQSAVRAQELREHLATTLPEYMVPAVYVRLECMPLKANGKVDHKALPTPEVNTHATRQYEEPVGELETSLAGIWRKLLRVERVGRLDDFFELGGHSLLVVRLVSRVRQTLGVDLAIGDVFLRPRLSSLSAYIHKIQLEEFEL